MNGVTGEGESVAGTADGKRKEVLTLTRKAREASLALTTGMAPGLGPVMVTCTGRRAVEDTVAACGTATPYSPSGLPNLNQSRWPLYTHKHSSRVVDHSAQAVVSLYI